jgi:ATP-dependent RNA helicase DeaD
MNDTDRPDTEAGRPTGDTEPTDGFAALGLRPEILRSLTKLGYEEPTPIQRETIPLLLSGRDLLGQAATGTGKTAAFALPAINSIEPGDPIVPTVLVLVPTRELAMQVSEAMFKYGSEQRIRVAPIYGGQLIGRQLQMLDRGVHVVVATPGRAIDHINRGSLTLDTIRTVILDEADEMLDMGFAEDIETILEETPEDRQTVLFSATMPPRINAIAKRHQRNPARVELGRSDDELGSGTIAQSVYFVHRQHKASALARVLDIEAPVAALVFCRTRTEVDELTETMNGRGYRAEALHGGLNQAQRDRVMSRLRDGAAELLIATDVAARGLDVDRLTHVINFEVPAAPATYVHRIGRVGRAGREGTAITLAEPRQRRLLDNIERLTRQTIVVKKVPTIGDLRARQLELTVEALREALSTEDLDTYASVLDDTALMELAGEDGMRNIALAAIKLVHEERGAVLDEVEIPDAFGGKRPQSDRPQRDRPQRGDRDAGMRPDRSRGASDGTGLLYVNLGSSAGVRPGDLVGAIANSAEIPGNQIGPIRISDHYSVVGVPEDAVDLVIRRMGQASLRGRRVRVRRYVD